MNLLYQYTIVLIAIISTVSVSAQVPDSVLTLKLALVIALEKSPEFTVFSSELRAGEARILQAGLRPNPELKLTTEDFAGSGDFKSTRQLQTTLQLSHTLELGKKREARRKYAFLSLDMTEREHEQVRFDVVADVTTRFFSLVAAQNNLEVSKQFAVTAKTSLQSIQERLAAGKGSVLEDKKAAVTLLRSKIDEEKAGRELNAALQGLTAALGSTTPSFRRAEADLFTLYELPSLEILVSLIPNSPAMLHKATEKQWREAALAVERSKGIPNLSIGGGVRRIESSGDQAFVAEFSLPLPFLDRNQGARSEAKALLEKNDIDQQLVQARLQRNLYALYQEVIQTAREISITRSEIIPQAENALKIAEDGFHLGRFTYLELSDAQNSLLAIKQRYIEAARLYHTLVAEIERLTGQTLQQ